jgi:tRNA A-37 threonylcarbamoyl transferase component Bud32/tetratricopeptide (TPR) repeat protein
MEVVDETKKTADLPTRCLDDSTILRFVSGQLDETARRAVEDEIGSCPHCSALVAELIRGSAVLHVESAGGDGPECEPIGAERSDRGGSLSRYVLGPMIARGGMGTILAAFDRRLSRSVVVKRMDRSDPSLAERFHREIRVTASLQHPGIVPIYDAGFLDDGQPFYAMRHVSGASLEHAMMECDGDGKRLGLLASVLAAAEAVAYAHERGIIHRDLKPSNILVGPFGETVVIDWGLAGIEATSGEPAGSDLAHDHDPMAPMMTRRGSVLGTPRYMAPEQARGEPATRRSDVYALGAILYHTLSGVPPVAGDEVTLVLERVARAEVRPLREVGPGLPSDLAAIVERAMAREPEARYGSAGELAADLRRFQTGQLVAAHRYSRGDLARRFVKRHRAAVVFAALLISVLAVGGTLSVRGIVRERERAEDERSLAERERAGAEDLVKFLLFELRARLSTVGRLDVLSGVADRVEAYYMTTAAGRAEAPQALRERAALNDLRAAVASTGGDAASADLYLERGLALLDRAPPASATDEVRGDLISSKARRAARTADFARARALYLEAMALYRSNAAGDRPEDRHQRDLKIAARLTSAAEVADRLDKPLDAEREWKQATDILEERRASDPGDLEAAKRLGELRMKIGQRRYRRGQVDSAESSLRAALADGEQLAARAPKDSEVEYLVAWSAISLANLRYGRGDLDEARRLQEQAHEVATTMLAVEPASAVWQVIPARTAADLGTIAFDRSDWAEAARRFASARATYEQLVARDPTNREHRRAAALAVAQLADAETALRRFDAALAAWLAALDHLAELARSNAPEPRLEWAYGLRGYAAFERRRGRLAAARPAIERALELVDGTPTDADLPAMTYYRASVLAEAAAERDRRGQRREAVAAWQHADALLRGLAERVPLEADWAKALHEIEGELDRRASRTDPSRGRR